MECNAVRHGLDAAFDAGRNPDEALLAHTAVCPACAGYARSLTGLDSLLLNAPQVGEDPALVARIQASIAAQPPAPVLAFPLHRWSMLAAALAALLAGWYLDLDRMLPAPGDYPVSLHSVIFPDWQAMRGELLSVPAAIAAGIQDVARNLGAAWGSGSAQLVNALGEYGIWLWPAFAVCLVAALSLDTQEVLSRHHRRPRS